jgi:hypothetical protein
VDARPPYAQGRGIVVGGIHNSRVIRPVIWLAIFAENAIANGAQSPPATLTYVK